MKLPFFQAYVKIGVTQADAQDLSVPVHFGLVCY